MQPYLNIVDCNFDFCTTIYVTWLFPEVSEYFCINSLLLLYLGPSNVNHINSDCCRLRASSFGAAASLAHLVTGVGFLLLQLAEETRLVRMLCSGRCYQPEEMSEVADLLKGWMAKEQQREEEREEERRCHVHEKEEEKRRYEERQAAERIRCEGLIRELTERRPHRVEVGPESLLMTWKRS